jgi:uncharacterized Fe-S cluster-containing radical SAM superfamily protein
MDQGKWHPECSDCMKIESDPQYRNLSKRMLWNSYYGLATSGTEGLIALIMDTGNLCNLACRTCGPYLSSSWVKEYEHFNKNKTWSIQLDSRLKIESWDLKNLRYLELLGGEPFHNPKTFDIINRVIRETDNQCLISIITNGTIFPDINKYEWFINNNKIHLVVSVDAIGKPVEFIRTGSNWEKISQNVRKYLDLGITVGYHPTHSILNLFEIDKIEQWRIDNGIGDCPLLTIVNDPQYLDFSVLTDREKQKVCDYLSTRTGRYLIPYIEAETHSVGNRKEFFELMDRTKHYHALDWREYLPELYSLLAG